jgi:transposase
MAKPLLPDGPWKRIEPLVPPPKPRRFRYPGRQPIDDRKALIGILFVPKTGIRWEDLPREMGCGSGMTCWRRLRDRLRARGIDPQSAVRFSRVSQTTTLNNYRGSNPG